MPPRIHVALCPRIVTSVAPSARCVRFSGGRSFSTCSTRSASDDFYSLLLENPIPSPSRNSVNCPPSSLAPSTISPIPENNTPPQPQVSFSTPLAGPSARMRGLARAERGLEKPQEPDNCCMSGCVNCVWDAYREEVEEWAKARRRKDAESSRSGMKKVGRSTPARGLGKGLVDEQDGSEGVGDMDEVGRGLDLDLDDGALFADVPVGIREFMATEKRLRERRAKEEGPEPG